MTDYFKVQIAGMPEGQVLINVHPMDNCVGRPCVVHNPSDHHMRSWPLHWRNDRGIFERICEHGTGHPDPDQFAFWDEQAVKWEERQRGATQSVSEWNASPVGNPWVGMGIHGCDGCCRG
jgi:hypothetical protein